MGFPFPTHGGGVGPRFSLTQVDLWSYKKQRLSSPLGKGRGRKKANWQNYSQFCGEISMKQRGRDTTQIRNVKNLIKGTVWERKGHSRGAAKAAAANGCRVLSRHKKTTPKWLKAQTFCFLNRVLCHHLELFNLHFKHLPRCSQPRAAGQNFNKFSFPLTFPRLFSAPLPLQKCIFLVNFLWLANKA